MRISFFIILIVLLPVKATFAQDAPEASRMVLPQVQVIPIGDTQSNRQYELYVELPEGYEENPEKQYQVLYYTDAIWHMEVLSACAEYVLTEAILVGISWQKDINEELIEEYGVHVSRYRDYTVKASDNPEYQAKYQFGKADEHIAFIHNDVIPFIEANYRSDPGNRSYFGYSASGLFGAYILMTQPETFKHYLLGSPSLKGDIATLKQVGSDLNEVGINANVFISHGDQEEETGSYVREFVELLKNRNDASLNINYEVMDGNHQTAFPMTGVRSANWLYSKLNE
ncbi:MAG: alpha/beta hydrolase-fold protein [Bacteroidota bacterium]